MAKKRSPAKKSQKRSPAKKSQKRSVSKKSQKRSGKKRSASKKSVKRRGTISMKKRSAQTDNPCRSYKKVNCGSVDPSCNWRKRVGCVRRGGAASKGLVYEGPSMLPQ
jgi:hypothetical protein